MAAIYNFTGENAMCQGATWSWSVILSNYLTGQPLNITGYTARMQLREHIPSTTTLLELTTANARLTITGASGLISASVDATTTAALTFDRAVYDLEIVNGATVTRILQGVVDLDKEVTR